MAPGGFREIIFGGTIAPRSGVGGATVLGGRKIGVVGGVIGAGGETMAPPFPDRVELQLSFSTFSRSC